MSKLTRNLLLNTITDRNYMQSVLPQRKITQFKVPNKTTKQLLRLRNIETNKINKEQCKTSITHMTCYI